MPPGPQNALGARAMYLFNKGGDSGYRLHGTPEWFSIGKAMSSGCIRLMNQDIIDLYDRAEVGAKVIVEIERDRLGNKDVQHEKTGPCSPVFYLFG